MSQVIAIQEADIPEMYDWHHEDLFKRPPYNHTDMVNFIAEGKFIIEGHRSNFNDAVNYCHANDCADSWNAMRQRDRATVPSGMPW